MSKINYFFEDTTSNNEILPNKSWIENSIEMEGRKLGCINLIICSDNYLVKINKKFYNFIITVSERLWSANEKKIYPSFMNTYLIKRPIPDSIKFLAQSNGYFPEIINGPFEDSVVVLLNRIKKQ